MKCDSISFIIKYPEVKISHHFFYDVQPIEIINVRYNAPAGSIQRIVAEKIF